MPEGSEGNITPNAESVGRPKSSEFRKFPILTSPRPGGMHGATISINQKNCTFHLLDKK